MQPNLIDSTPAWPPTIAPAAGARVIRLLHEDPNMRQEFINRVAAPIANKLFECGLIP